MSQAQIRPMSIGEILDGAFALYRRHFAVMFVTALIPLTALVPLYASWMGSGVVATPQAAVAQIGLSLLVLVGYTLGVIVVMGALTRQVSQAYSGGDVAIGDGFARGLRALFPLIGAAILSYVVVFGVAIIVSIVAAVLVPAAASGAISGSTVIIIATVGVLVALVVGFGLMAGMFAVVPAVVIERKGPLGSLIRSWQLSRGARTRIGIVGSLAWLITTLPMLGIMFALGLGVALVDPTAAATMTTGQLYAQQGAGILCGALTLPFMVGCLVLLYYDRRIRIEGYDLEVAAAAISTTA